MDDVTITVRGEHQRRVAPERATAYAHVSADGPDRASVLDQAGASAARVRETVTSGADAGTLVEWSSSAVSVHADRPWNPEGKRLAPIYRASITFTATFADASELSLWVNEVSALDGVTINGVNWYLTPERRAAVEREVATEAIRVAVTRAEAYAAALGRNHVSPVSVADHGILNHAEAIPATMRLNAAESIGGMGVDLEPEDIVIAATVEARFVAR